MSTLHRSSSSSSSSSTSTSTSTTTTTSKHTTATSTSTASAARVVRLNHFKFPPTAAELDALDRHGITVLPFEPELEEVSAGEIEALLAEHGDIDALLIVSAKLQAGAIEVLGRASSCRVVARLGTGCDKIDDDALSAHGIVLANVPEFCTEEMADHSFALLLSIVRQLPAMHQAVSNGSWTQSRIQCQSIPRLRGTTIGLVGFGASARAMAIRAKAFGMEVLANRSDMEDSDGAAAAAGVQLLPLELLLPRCDFVSLHLPLTSSNQRLIDAAALALMRRGAILINTSRGGLVDEPAMVAALRSGQLGGAGIDCFERILLHGDDTPPTPEQHLGLTELPNVQLTPHVAAYSTGAMQQQGSEGVENLALALRGALPALRNIVNPAAMQRWRERFGNAQPLLPPLAANSARL
jgi:phosphoglycerate dehydrogenase-like enzyme